MIWKTVVILSKFAIEKLADELYNGRNVPAHDRAEYGPHWDTLSLRDARSGSNAANYAA